MQHLTAIWLLALLNGIAVLTAAGVGAYVLAARSGDDADPADWYDGALELASEVRRAAESAGTPADPDRVARRLLPLAGRIQGHVRAAPDSADPATYRQLHSLGMACQDAALELRRGAPGGPFLEDRLSRLRASALALESTARAG